MNTTTSTIENQVSPETLPVITWQKARVITTELLARLYGTETDNIRQNFSANSDRFVDGKHFFKLDGDALREFKNCVSNPHAVQKHTRNLTLWTERGAARHAKMLDTDAAWEVFERLEDYYFATKKIIAPEYGQAELPIDVADLLLSSGSNLTLPLPQHVQESLDARAWELAGEAYQLIRQHLVRRIAFKCQYGNPRIFDANMALKLIKQGDLGHALAGKYYDQVGQIRKFLQIGAEFAEKSIKSIEEMTP